VAQWHVDPEDTIDSVVFGIIKLQKEGWALSSMTIDVVYQEPGPQGPKQKKRKLPVETVMTVRLRVAT
jgi:hypothetical protein